MEQEQIRIEELDSDDTDTQGVGLDYVGKRFATDPLKFTGVDLSSKPQARRGYSYEDSDSDSGSGRGHSDSEDEGNQSARQIALRDKEEALVQSALARIRRAQERGKREVKLNPDELAALEKRRKRLLAAGTSSKSQKKISSSSSGSDRKRRNERAMVAVPIVQPEPRRHSDRHRDQSPPRTASGGPGLVVEGPGGLLSYAPIGHYPAETSNRSSPSRPRSSTSLSRHSRPSQPSDYAQGGRNHSEEMRPNSSSNSPRLPLPHEEGWIPGSRRSSVSSQSYSNDPFEYQTSSGYPPPIPAQYVQSQNSGRRNVSGPPQVLYSSVRRSPPYDTSASSSRMRYDAMASASDPSLGRRRGDEFPDSQGSRSSTEEDDYESDDQSHGVSVEPDRHQVVVSRKPVGGSSGRKKSRR